VIAAQTLDLLIDRDVLPKHAEIDLKGLSEVIAIMGEAGTLAAPLPRPDRFVDLQYLRSAGERPDHLPRSKYNSCHHFL
jgi:hypothetical protein